jgi:valyl-tRNA synthetase
MPNKTGSIMVSEYPRYNAKLAYKKEALAFQSVMEVITAVRNVKTELACPPSKKVSLYVVTDSKRILSANEDSILKLAGASELKFVSSPEEVGQKTIAKVISCGTIYIPMGELVDFAKERARLEGELEKVMAEIRRADGKLNNQGFIAKAPKKLVDEEREKRNKYLEMREKLQDELASLPQQ